MSDDPILQPVDPNAKDLLEDGWITVEQYWQGRRDSEYPLPAGYEDNAIDLLKRVNMLLDEFMKAHPERKDPETRSGYRPKAYNAMVGGAKASRHLYASAIDISDNDEALDNWIDKNPDVLVKYGLWREHPSKTRSWCHLDTLNRGPNHTFWP